jgi:hypothetical protein
MSFIICFFNSLTILNIPISILVLLIQLIYLILINYKINPYKNSLKIHKRTLLVNQLIYFMFLVLLNIINFFPSINDILIILFGYGTIFILSLSNFSTIARIYF